MCSNNKLLSARDNRIGDKKFHSTSKFPNASSLRITNSDCAQEGEKYRRIKFRGIQSSTLLRSATYIIPPIGKIVNSPKRVVPYRQVAFSSNDKKSNIYFR